MPRKPRTPKVAVPLHVVGETIRDQPDQILDEYRKTNRSILSDLITDKLMRQSIIESGIAEKDGSGRQLRVKTRPIPGTDDHEVLGIATVARDPGLTRDLVDAIQDFLPTAEKPNLVRIQQFWRIYQTVGIVNNAINKFAALLSSGGRFKVKYAKKGKKQDAVEQLQAILDEFYYNVNAAPLDGVVSSARGLKMVQQQAVRQALVEGDWIGRSVWTKHQVGTIGSFSMPMTIQSISLAYIEAVPGLAGTGIDAFYWKPDPALIRLLTSSGGDKNVLPLLKKYIPSEVLAELKKTGKAFMDPALLLHVKNRGVWSSTYGESYIEPAMFAIAYARSVESLDLVMVQNLINRITVVMVGSSDKESPYSKPEVAQARAALMQSFFDDPGPNMTIVWQGDDVKVADIGGDKVLQLDERHRIGDGKIKGALGVPESLLTGTAQGTDGKAAGWAAAIGAAAVADELQSGFVQCWTTVGERIAEENGFDEYDIVFEPENSLMVDRNEEWNQTRNDYIAGIATIKDTLISRRKDPEAAFQQMCFEKGLNSDSATWQEAFMPPVGLPGQGADGGVPGTAPNKPADGGRPTNNESGNTPSRAPRSKPTPTENK